MCVLSEKNIPGGEGGGRGQNLAVCCLQNIRFCDFAEFLTHISSGNISLECFIESFLLLYFVQGCPWNKIGALEKYYQP